MVTTVAGSTDATGYDGMGTNANLNFVFDLALSSNNHIFVADQAMIRRIDLSGERVLVAVLK